MAHFSDFLAGLQKAAQLCDTQAQTTGGVANGPMAEDPASLALEANSVGATNSAAAIRAQIRAHTEGGEAANEDTEGEDLPLVFADGLALGIVLCEQIAEECQGFAESKFVTPEGRLLHEAMARGAVAAGDAVRAFLDASSMELTHDIG